MLTIFIPARQNKGDRCILSAVPMSRASPANRADSILSLLMGV